MEADYPIADSLDGENMCMDIDKVTTCMIACRYAYKYKHQRMFDYYIEKLAEQLKGVIIGAIDHDALVHSFL